MLIFCFNDKLVMLCAYDDVSSRMFASVYSSLDKIYFS